MQSSSTAAAAFAPRLDREPRGENIVFRLNGTEVGVLDRYAAAAGLSRAEYIRRAIGASIAAAPAA